MTVGVLTPGIASAATTDGWEPQSSGTPTRLTSVTFVDASTGWAVGNGGWILHTSDGGASWSPQATPTTQGLNSVAFVDSSTGWAVGSNYTILHTTDGGTSWSPQTPVVFLGLRSVAFVDANTGWTVGDHGTILHTTDGGASWDSQPSGTTEDLRSIAIVDESTGWAVGDAGTILHTIDGGASWSLQPSAEAKPALYSVDFVDANNGWATGDFGMALRTTDGGANWIRELAPTDSILYSVDFVDASNGWAVSDRGTVFHTSDGGLDWNVQDLQFHSTYARLYSVAFVDANTGWTVGDSGTILHTTDGGAGQPPVTTIAFDPPNPDGMSGWFVTQPSVSFATSKPGSTTRYQFDQDFLFPWGVRYLGPFAPPEGEHRIYYRSEDLWHHEEAHRFQDYKVDLGNPSAPTLALVDSGATTADLSWTSSTDAISGVSGYRVYRHGSGTPLASTSGTSVTVTGLNASTDYTLYVRAVDVAGRVSPSSNKVDFMTPAQSVSIGPGPSVTASTPSGVTITFDQVTGGGTVGVSPSSNPYPDPTGFRIEDGCYYDITFTGTFDGSFTVELPYDPRQISGREHDLVLFHRKDGEWEGITRSVDVARDTISGRADSFSGFGSGYPSGSELGTPASTWWSLALLVLVGSALMRRRRHEAELALDV